MSGRVALRSWGIIEVSLLFSLLEHPLEMMIHLIHRPVLNKYVDKQSTNCCLIS